jgi:hypothetical protein
MIEVERKLGEEMTVSQLMSFYKFLVDVYLVIVRELASHTFRGEVELLDNIHTPWTMRPMPIS